jgi:hypothetical protein
MDRLQGCPCQRRRRSRYRRSGGHGTPQRSGKLGLTCHDLRCRSASSHAHRIGRSGKHRKPRPHRRALVHSQQRRACGKRRMRSGIGLFPAHQREFAAITGARTGSGQGHSLHSMGDDFRCGGCHFRIARRQFQPRRERIESRRSPCTPHGFPSNPHCTIAKAARRASRPRGHAYLIPTLRRRRRTAPRCLRGAFRCGWARQRPFRFERRLA